MRSGGPRGVWPVRQSTDAAGGGILSLRFIGMRRSRLDPVAGRAGVRKAKKPFNSGGSAVDTTCRGALARAAPFCAAHAPVGETMPKTILLADDSVTIQKVVAISFRQRGRNRPDRRQRRRCGRQGSRNPPRYRARRCRDARQERLRGLRGHQGRSRARTDSGAAADWNFRGLRRVAGARSGFGGPHRKTLRSAIPDRRSSAPDRRSGRQRDAPSSTRTRGIGREPGPK